MPEIAEKTTNPEKLELRACVARFAQIMERRLRENDHKRHWPRPTHSECCAYIDRHLLTVIKHSALADPMAMTERDEATAADNAAADVANVMLMMLGFDVNRENLNRRD